eukprot:306544-Rhodomonas_salina.1
MLTIPEDELEVEEPGDNSTPAEYEPYVKVVNIEQHSCSATCSRGAADRSPESSSRPSRSTGCW